MPSATSTQDVYSVLTELETAVSALDRQLGDAIQQFSKHTDTLRAEMPDTTQLTEQITVCTARIEEVLREVDQRLDVDTLIEQMMPHMASPIDRAAAESAARVLMEELAALIQA